MKKTLIFLFLLCAALLCMPLSASAAANPTADNLELDTWQGVPVEGWLSAHSEESLHLIFRVTTQPVKGSVALQADGSFIYTPQPGRRGRDYFGFKATDEWGRESQEATVIIRLLKKQP